MRRDENVRLLRTVSGNRVSFFAVELCDRRSVPARFFIVRTRRSTAPTILLRSLFEGNKLLVGELEVK